MNLIQGMLQSKTMWFNGAVTVLGVITWATDHSVLITTLAPQLAPILTVIGAVGMVLRVLTEKTPAWNAQGAPVEDRSKPYDPDATAGK
jgi:uncharacterized membrane-anchored protein